MTKLTSKIKLGLCSNKSSLVVDLQRKFKDREEVKALQKIIFTLL